jgi:perosamine synthetase
MSDHKADPIGRDPMADPANPRGVHATPQPVLPVYRPDLSGNERAYVLECIDSSWISSLGAFIDRFERAVAELTGARHAIAVCNGTVALHLAIHSLDIGPGDEVIVPSFTYISSVNTIAQTGATPVFCECRASDWLLDVDDVARRITPRTKAIMAVHLYGHPCDMQPLMALAERHGLAVIEDCAEALGTTLGGRHVGRFGAVGTFSFFGNKTVTTGEGGMVICDDDALAARLRQTKGQGQSLTRRYWHEILGFNYRMTNIAAAIGTAQMERLPSILKRKRALAAQYRALLADVPVTFQEALPGTVGSDWLVSLLLPDGASRDRTMADLQARGIETRPVFFPAHHMPMYAQKLTLPVAESIAARGMSLPSYPDLMPRDVERVATALRDALRNQGFDGR